MKGKYLITTDSWFFGPDGKQYRAAWGDVEILSDNILGIKTNSRSANWFAKVGTDEKHVIIAGCQIHYCVKSNNAPITDKVLDYNTHDGKEFERPTQIYIAE